MTGIVTFLAIGAALFFASVLAGVVIAAVIENRDRHG